MKKSSQWIWLVFAVVLVALAGAGYRIFGGNLGSILVPHKAGDASSSSAGPGPTPSLKALSDEQLERMIAQAAELTQRDAKNASAWAMLAHSYEMLGKFSESAKAYAKLTQLLPQDAQVLADYADVLAVANGRSFKGEPIALLQQALALDARNVKALVLAGSAAMEQQDAAQAMAYLERARSAATDVALKREIDASLAQAKAASGAATVAPKLPPVASGVQGQAPSAPVQVSGRVWLSEALRAKVPAQATLFLFARPVAGSRMPVALLRKKVGDLPLNFTLDDSMAMVSNMSLSTQSQVVVVARISLRGNVTPEAGDLEGRSAPVSVGSRDLKLEISEVLK